MIRNIINLYAIQLAIVTFYSLDVIHMFELTRSGLMPLII